MDDKVGTFSALKGVLTPVVLKALQANFIKKYFLNNSFNKFFK